MPNENIMEASQQDWEMAEGNVIIKRTTLPARCLGIFHLFSKLQEELFQILRLYRSCNATFWEFHSTNEQMLQQKHQIIAAQQHICCSHIRDACEMEKMDEFS